MHESIVEDKTEAKHVKAETKRNKRPLEIVQFSPRKR